MLLFNHFFFFLKYTCMLLWDLQQLEVSLLYNPHKDPHQMYTNKDQCTYSGTRRAKLGYTGWYRHRWTRGVDQQSINTRQEPMTKLKTVRIRWGDTRNWNTWQRETKGHQKPTGDNSSRTDNLKIIYIHPLHLHTHHIHTHMWQEQIECNKDVSQPAMPIGTEWLALVISSAMQTCHKCSQKGEKMEVGQYIES